MVPKRIMQVAMDEVSRRFHCSLAGYDMSGNCVVTAGKGATGPPTAMVRRFAHSHMNRLARDGMMMVKIHDLSDPDMIVAVEPCTDNKTAVKAAELVMDMLLYQQRDRFDMEDFYRRLFAGTICRTDLLGCASELGLERPHKRMVCAISFEGSRGMVLADRLCTALREKMTEFVMVYRHVMVLVIHEALVDEQAEAEAREQMEKTMVRTAAALTQREVYIGCGTYAEDISSLRRSFEEAQAAIKTGRTFQPHMPLHRYEELFLEHVVSHLPKHFCRWFLRQAFSDASFFDDLDDETARTAIVFLDNTMNAAETSKQLFFHRNTLRYRLINIQGQSGLDLRKFRDASIFKLGWAIHRYVKCNEAGDSEEVL